MPLLLAASLVTMLWTPASAQVGMRYGPWSGDDSGWCSLSDPLCAILSIPLFAFAAFTIVLGIVEDWTKWRNRRALERQDELTKKYMDEGLTEAEAQARAQAEMRDNPKRDWRRDPGSEV
jgi:hypothetical protein